MGGNIPPQPTEAAKLIYLREIERQLNEAAKASYIAEIERLSDPQLQARWTSEVDELQVLLDAHVDTGLVGQQILNPAIAIHEWRRDAIQTLIEQRHRMQESTRAIATSLGNLALAHDRDLTELGIAGRPLTDAGNAEVFALIFGDVVRHDHKRRKWLLWISPRWHIDPNGELDRLVLAAVRKRGEEAFAHLTDKKELQRAVKWALTSESRPRLKAMLELAQSMEPLADPGGNWDCDDWLIGCDNGLINLREGILRDGRPDDRVTLSTRIDFDGSAQCPRWQQFLDEVFGDSELIDFVQRAVGYSLTGDTSEQVLFIPYGNGANGKSVFLSIAQDILGDYGGNTPFATLELLDHHGPSNDLAAIAGKRLITASESRENARMNEARVKALTGGDVLTARFLFGEFFSFQPKAKLWLAVNHKPNVSDDSYGFWRRIRLIPFTRTFGPDKADPRLLEKLREELPGILAWAVRGCLEWQSRGLEPPAPVKDATEAYRVESDPLARFLEERCQIGEDKQTSASELRKAYETWCAANGEKEISSTAFGRRLGERFTKERKREAGSVKLFYSGVGLCTV